MYTNTATRICTTPHIHTQEYWSIWQKYFWINIYFGRIIILIIYISFHSISILFVIIKYMNRINQEIIISFHLHSFGFHSHLHLHLHSIQSQFYLMFMYTSLIPHDPIWWNWDYSFCNVIIYKFRKFEFARNYFIYIRCLLWRATSTTPSFSKSS